MKHLKIFEEYKSKLFNFSYEPIEVSEEGKLSLNYLKKRLKY